MSTELLLVLSEKVQFIPVSTLDKLYRNKFSHEPDDIVITLKNTRKNSKVISRAISALLKEFVKPITPAAGIIAYASKNSLDPLEVASEVYDALRSMYSQGFLIAEVAGSRKENTDSTYNINDLFREYTIKEKFQWLEDTEVYRVENTSGSSFVLKIFRMEKEGQTEPLFINEKNILKKLDGRVNPVLVEEGLENGLRFLLTTWFDGIHVTQYARQYCNYNIRSNIIRVLNLCIDIINAYDWIHSQGIIHSDIHEGNILVSNSGNVHIIDFGSAFILNDIYSMQRKGIGFSYEPEYANAILQKMPVPLPNKTGEQYTLATLLYQIISGHQYLRFSVEHDALLNQIVKDKPVPFTDYDLYLPNELDEIFRKALAKNPNERYSSLKHFSFAFENIRDRIESTGRYPETGKYDTEKNYLDFIVNKFGWGSDFLKHGFKRGPAHSVNYGSAGIAYMFYRMACINRDPGLLELADLWSSRSYIFKENYEQAFFSGDIDISEKTVGLSSIYHSPSGLHLVRAMISSNRGNIHEATVAYKNFISTPTEEVPKIDLATGQASLLAGSAIMFNELQTMEGFQVKPLKEFALGIMTSIWKKLEKYPSINISDPINYYGIAHGWAGILYATILWCYKAQLPLPLCAERKIEELIQIGSFNEHGANWPVSENNTSTALGWCKGNAGYVFLWTILYQYSKKDKYLEIAEKAAYPMIKNYSTRLVNLCCGEAGEAYSMLRMYNLTGNTIYLEAAHTIKESILYQLSSPQLYNNSLYKGDPGIAVLLTECKEPALARMPLFE